MYTFFTLLTILTTLSGYCMGQYSCPRDNNNACIEGDYPNTYDCNKFWTCDTSCNYWDRDCPATLHFSGELKMCLNPVDAKCEVSTTAGSATTVPTTPLPSTTTTTTATVTSSTPGGPTTPAIFVNPSVFFVARTSAIRGSQDPVVYEAEVNDRHNDFDITTDRFTAPSDGFYYFMLTAGYEAGRAANLRLEPVVGSVPMVNVRKRSSSHTDIDTGSRDIIYQLKQGDQLHTTQLTVLGGLHSSTRGLETSWGGFSLHDSMETVSAFSSGRESEWSTTGVVVMDTEVSDYGDDWSGQSYTAPQTGTYFFSISVGVDTAQSVNVGLSVNSQTVAELYKNHGDNDDIVTFSRSLVVNLNQGDVVSYNLLSGQLWSNDRLQTSISGFFYKPLNTPKVAWSVHKTESWNGFLALDPVNFDDIFVNEKDVYDTSSNHVVIPYAGFYYIYLGAGADADEPVDISIVYNDEVALMHLTREATTSGVDTLSRGAVWYLETGDTLNVKAERNTALYGDASRRLTSFQGFLIYSNY